jgi:hypothetical protein
VTPRITDQFCGALHVCAAKGGQGVGAEQRKLHRADAPHPHASSKLVAPSARPPQCRASELRLAGAQPRPRMGEVTVFKANSFGVHLYTPVPSARLDSGDRRGTSSGASRTVESMSKTGGVSTSKRRGGPPPPILEKMCTNVCASTRVAESALTV